MTYLYVKLHEESESVIKKCAYDLHQGQIKQKPGVEGTRIAKSDLSKKDTRFSIIFLNFSCKKTPRNIFHSNFVPDFILCQYRKPGKFDLP